MLMRVISDELRDGNDSWHAAKKDRLSFDKIGRGYYLSQTVSKISTVTASDGGFDVT